MFKTERRVLDDKYRAFLVDQLGVQEVAHSGRDFFTHLSQTYKLLKSWGNPEPVCLAGLFHSIYGTQHFRHEAFSIEKRDVIRELIGEQAEFLAYVFCVTNRPRVFLEQLHSSDLVFTDSHTGEHLRLTNDAFDQLLEIEAANLIEQGGNVRPALEKIAQANISAKAKNAIAQYLAKV